MQLLLSKRKRGANYEVIEMGDLDRATVNKILNLNSGYVNAKVAGLLCSAFNDCECGSPAT